MQSERSGHTMQCQIPLDHQSVIRAGSDLYRLEAHRHMAALILVLWDILYAIS